MLTNGRIYTVNEAQPWAEAVAIRNGKIVHVGDNTSASKFEAARTTDLGGRMIMPGIVDGHTHPGLIGVEQFQIDSEATEHETLMADLKAWADANPGEGWVRGCCWPVGTYVDGAEGPNRDHLDAIFPHRPLWRTSSA